MQWKDSIGRLRRKPLGFIKLPLILKRTICGIRVVAWDDVDVSYYVYYKICKIICKNIIQKSKCRFHNTNVYGFGFGVVFFLVNWADIIPQKV